MSNHIDNRTEDRDTLWWAFICAAALYVLWATVGIIQNTPLPPRDAAADEAP